MPRNPRICLYFRNTACGNCQHNCNFYASWQFSLEEADSGIKCLSYKFSSAVQELKSIRTDIFLGAGHGQLSAKSSNFMEPGTVLKDKNPAKELPGSELKSTAKPSFGAFSRENLMRVSWLSTFMQLAYTLFYCITML